MDSDTAVNEFLRRMTEDRARGTPRPLEDYQASFPEHAEVIAREWAQIHGEAETSTPESLSPPGVRDGRIGPYALIGEIGRGGQGVVYLAEDTRLRRRVALKILTQIGRLSRDGSERFQREAEVAARLDHPGICTVFDAGEERGVLYIAMRHLEGLDLATLLDRARSIRSSGGTVAPTDPPIVADLCAGRHDPIVAFVEKIARAAAAAHDAGVIHRDIKPANVIVTAAGEPVLVDFGLARDLEGSETGITRTDGVLGTPAYAAPEQIQRSGRAVDARADGHALGVVLYECLTLRRPFEGATREELYRAILQDDPVDPGRLNRTLPMDVRTILGRALAKKPEARYPTAHAFAEDLGRLRRGEPIEARPVPALGRALRLAVRHPIASMALVFLLLLAAGGGFLLARLPEIRTGRETARAQAREARLESAWNLLGNEDHAAAIDAFERALEDDPESASALTGLALTRLATDGAKAAIDSIDGQRDVSSRPHAIRRLRNDLASAAGLPQGDACGEPVTALDWFVEGSVALSHAATGRLGYAARAADDLTRAVLFPGDRPIYYYFRLAEAVERADRPALARDVSKILLDHVPGTFATRYWAARALGRVDPEAALTIYDGLCRDDPTNVPARVAAASVAFDRVKDPSRAQAWIREARRIAPGDFRAHVAEIDLLLGTNHPAEARASTVDLLEAHSARSRAWYVAGRAAIRLGDWALARRRLEECGRRDPLFWGVPSQLGKLWAGKGHVGAAIRCLEEAARLEPRAFVPRCDLGLSLLAVRRDVEAVAAFRSAIALDAVNPEAQRGLCRALLMTGDPRAALDVARKSAALEGDVPRLERAVERARARTSGMPPPPPADESDRLLDAVLAEAAGEFDRASRAWSACSTAPGPSPADVPAFRAALCEVRSEVARGRTERGRELRDHAFESLTSLREGWAGAAVDEPGRVRLALFASALIEDPALQFLRSGDSAALGPEERANWNALFVELARILREIETS